MAMLVRSAHLGRPLLAIQDLPLGTGRLLGGSRVRVLWS